MEQWLDVIEQADLLVDSVSTSLRNIKQKQNACIQMSQSCDGLHFDCIPCVKAVVQNSWSVNNLPACIVVFKVTQEQILSGKGIWLHVDIGICHVVHQTGFTNVGETCHDQSSLVSVDAW